MDDDIGLRPSLLAFLHIVALSTLAVTQPLFSLLTAEDHATFFISHHFDAQGIYALVLVLSLVLPLVTAAPVWLCLLVSRQLARGVLAAVLAILFAGLFSLLVSRLLGMSGYGGTAFSIVAAGGATGLLARSDWARQLLGVMSVTAIISPVLFLMDPAVAPLLETAEADPSRRGESEESHPDIVLVIFDQLPTTSILADENTIDEVVFPNFARLANRSTWHRSAATLYTHTREAIPSILTGSDVRQYRSRIKQSSAPAEKRVPDRNAYPSNLLTHFASTHSVLAVEAVTRMAPPRVADEDLLPATDSIPAVRLSPFSLRDSLLDTAIIYGHMLGPDALRSRLPPVTRQWGEFAGTRQVEVQSRDWSYVGDEPSRVKEFLDLLGRADGPGFYFLHVVLPHLPFQYDEAGTTYDRRRLIRGGKLQTRTGLNIWGSEELNGIAYQGHLMQAAFADRLLGEILDKLEAQAIYDDAMVVVTADHGLRFYWDDESLSKDPVHEIANLEMRGVPLFIKMPAQRDPRINDQLVLAVDIAPTIAAAMNDRLPWQTEGESVLTPVPETAKRIRYAGMSKTPASFEILRKSVVDYKTSVFNANSLSRRSPHRSLIDQETRAYAVRESEWKLQRRVSPGTSKRASANRPVYVSSSIGGTPEGLDAADLTIAIAVNGTIRATTRAIQDGHRIWFIAKMPPDAWEEAKNEVSIYQVVEDPAGEVEALVHIKRG